MHVQAQPVPAYVAPTLQTQADNYVDDTRGVYVPAHQQPRLKTPSELSAWQQNAVADVPDYMAGRPGGL